MCVISDTSGDHYITLKTASHSGDALWVLFVGSAALTTAPDIGTCVCSRYPAGHHSSADISLGPELIFQSEIRRAMGMYQLLSG